MKGAIREFDIKSRVKRMTALHKSHVERADFVKIKTGIAPDVFDLQKAIDKMYKRAARKLGLFNRYSKPHQSKQECVRRRNQPFSMHTCPRL